MILDQLIKLMPHATEDLKKFENEMLELFPDIEGGIITMDDLIMAFAMGHNEGGISAIKDLRARDKESDKQRLTNDKGIYS